MSRQPHIPQDQEPQVFQHIEEERPPEAPLPPSHADELLQPVAERMDRRAFLRLGVGLGASLLVLRQLTAGREQDTTGHGHESGPSKEPFDPVVKIRDHAVEFGDIDPTEQAEPVADKLRRTAPVFTLVHTAKENETVDQLAKRYYSGTDTEDTLTVARQALTASINANHTAQKNGVLQAGAVVYVPISEPVSVKKDGKTIAEIAAEWGLSEAAVVALNKARSQDSLAGELSDWVYLPVQQIPKLSEDERVYVLEKKEGGPTTYFGIAQELGTGLSTLIGRNKPDPAHLEYGHIIVASTKRADPTTTTSTTTTTPRTTTTSPNEPPRNPGDEDGVTPEDLMKKRAWTGEIVRTTESDKLEQDITIERLEEVVLTREGYEAWLKTIDKTSYIEVFEKAKTVWADKGVIENPDYFIIHHTAQGVEAGVAGMDRLTNSIKQNGLSVQWAISQQGQTYQLVTNPKLACMHAFEINDISTGVELVTDFSRAQGSVLTEQLTQAQYLAYFVGTEVYGRDMTQGVDFVRGHREANDLLGVGTAGKPDFFAPAMVQFRAKLLAFAKDMAE